MKLRALLDELSRLGAPRQWPIPGYSQSVKNVNGEIWVSNGHEWQNVRTGETQPLVVPAIDIIKKRLSL